MMKLCPQTSQIVLQADGHRVMFQCVLLFRKLIERVLIGTYIIYTIVLFRKLIETVLIGTYIIYTIVRRWYMMNVLPET